MSFGDIRFPCAGCCVVCRLLFGDCILTLLHKTKQTFDDLGSSYWILHEKGNEYITANEINKPTTKT